MFFPGEIYTNLDYQYICMHLEFHLDILLIVSYNSNN